MSGFTTCVCHIPEAAYCFVHPLRCSTCHGIGCDDCAEAESDA